MSTTATGELFEFRGVDDFYLAEVLQDNADGYVCGTPVSIPIQQVGKSTESSSEAHYYNNKAMIIINAEGADAVTLVVAPPVLELLAKITGRSFDASTGMMVGSPRVNKYFAIMYRTKGTDGAYRYVSRLKGQFGEPEETVTTENNGTETTNTTLAFTGIYTQHVFEKGILRNGVWEPSPAKDITVDSRYDLVDFSTFFSQVQTPDTVQAKVVPTVKGIGVYPSTASVTVGSSVALAATLYPVGAEGEITWTVTSGDTYASVSSDGVVTGLAEGTATVTATCGSYSDTCTVTVAES